MNDADQLARALVLQDMPWKDLILALPMVLSLCLAEGILTRAELRPIVIRAIHGIPAGDPLQGIPIDELLGAPSRADEIDDLYAELRLLADAAATDPAEESRYQVRLTRLRELQELEAQEMTAIAESRRQLQPGAFAAEMKRAQALLGNT